MNKNVEPRKCVSRYGVSSFCSYLGLPWDHSGGRASDQKCGVRGPQKNAPGTLLSDYGRGALKFARTPTKQYAKISKIGPLDLGGLYSCGWLFSLSFLLKNKLSDNF